MADARYNRVNENWWKYTIGYVASTQMNIETHCDYGKVYIWIPLLF
jgi:hypothetical protein